MVVVIVVTAIGIHVQADIALYINTFLKHIPGLLIYNQTLLFATRFELKMTAHLRLEMEAGQVWCL